MEKKEIFEVIKNACFTWGDPHTLELEPESTDDYVTVFVDDCRHNSRLFTFTEEDDDDPDIDDGLERDIQNKIGDGYRVIVDTHEKGAYQVDVIKKNNG